MPPNLTAAKITAGNGATAGRTFSDRFADYINVKEYGALGDNSHDDTANIQAAIDRNLNLAGSEANIGTIYFPRGTYKVTDSIYLPPGLHNQTPVGSNQLRLVGDGPAATAITGNVSGFILESGNHCSFTGSISGTTLTVTAIVSGGLCPLQDIDPDVDIIAPTTITVQLTGTTGGTGTYTVSRSYGGGVSSRAMLASATSSRSFSYSIEDMKVVNSNTTAIYSGCVRAAGGLGYTVKRVKADGMVGFTTEDYPGLAVTSAQLSIFEQCYHSDQMLYGDS